MAYSIIKGETPPSKAGVRAKYPFADLAVSDCFEVPLNKRGSVQNQANYFGRRLGRQFTVRKHSDSAVRVWRLK